MKNIIVSLWMILVTLFSGTVLAEEFIIGVENLDYMPYYSGISNDYKGFSRELLDAFAEKNGYTFTYEPLPVIRLFKSLLSNGVDFKFPDNPQWQREMKDGFTVVYSTSVVSTVDGVMVVPSNRGKGVHSLKRLGTVMGFTPWQYREWIDSGVIELSQNPCFDGLLKQAVNRRIDGAFLNPVVASWRLNNVLKASDALIFDTTLPHVKNDYLLSTLKHKHVIVLFNRFLKEEKPFINELKKKYKITDYR